MGFLPAAAIVGNKPLTFKFPVLDAFVYPCVADSDTA